jgi:hypothetical protein
MTMKVKQLIKQLQKLPQDDEIVITAMDDHFYCDKFEVHSPYDNGQAQEIILPVYVEFYQTEEEHNEEVPF